MSITNLPRYGRVLTESNHDLYEYETNPPLFLIHEIIGTDGGYCGQRGHIPNLRVVIEDPDTGIVTCEGAYRIEMVKSEPRGKDG